MMCEGKTCESCKHFRRHYVRRERNWYIPLDMGHCTYPRLKDRESRTPACQHYRAGAEGEQADPQ